MAREQETARRTVPIKCVACERPLDSPLFCNSCRRLYPADGLSFFELLGLHPGYDVVVTEVRRRYFELLREIHPDRMGAGNAEVQRLSMRVSAQINQAFQVLLDPVLRAEYLLELVGGKSAADDKQVPQEVLVDSLTLREEIDEAKTANDQAALDGLRQQVQGRFKTTLEEVASLARRLPGSAETRQRLRGKLNAIRYYRRILEQL
ncbi:MAG: Fe-S protein assembly co-chaperone HscB [Phycisphaerae bacterium]